MTSAHVVDESRDCLAGATLQRILAKPATGDPTAAGAVSCDIVSVDELRDLALLKAQRPLFRNASEASATTMSAELRRTFLLLDPGAIEDATEVAVTGHPAFAWHSETQSGRVVGHGSWALSDANSEKSDVLFVDIPLLKGSSGSPVYRVSDGSVVGIVERKDLQHPGRTIAVPIRYAIEMLDRAGVRWHPVQPHAGPE